MNISSWF